MWTFSAFCHQVSELQKPCTNYVENDLKADSCQISGIFALQDGDHLDNHLYPYPWELYDVAEILYIGNSCWI